MEKLIIKNASVIFVNEKKTRCCDILVENGVISEISDCICRDGAEIFDAGGLVCAPGIVDMHVHLRDPGQTHKEDIFTAAKAAAAGGVTAVLAMPNTKPPVSEPDILKDILARAKGASIRIYQSACVTRSMKGEELTDFDAMRKAGAAAFSDDGRPVENARLMMQALINAARLGVPVLSHAEDLNIVNGGIMNDGKISAALGVKGIHRASEDSSTAREAALAAAVDRRVHICHVSTRGSVAIIRDAKRRGVKITCETAPHYFSLTDDMLLSRDADYRMNPPLREKNDVSAVIDGIIDGTIDAIATDHAPHTAEEKSCFETAPNGVIGLQTLLPAAYTKLVKAGHIDIYRLFELLSCNPAAILGINSNRFEIGDIADMVIFDPEETFTVEKENMLSRSSNTAFKGMELNGAVKYTVCGGKVIYRAQ